MSLLERGDDAVFKATEADVGFREEVAGAAGWVEERA